MKQSLDAKKDASEIMRQMGTLEFPFIITKVFIYHTLLIDCCVLHPLFHNQPWYCII